MRSLAAQGCGDGWLTLANLGRGIGNDYSRRYIYLGVGIFKHCEAGHLPMAGDNPVTGRQVALSTR